MSMWVLAPAGRCVGSPAFGSAAPDVNRGGPHTWQAWRCLTQRSAQTLLYKRRANIRRRKRSPCSPAKRGISAAIDFRRRRRRRYALQPIRVLAAPCPTTSYLCADMSVLDSSTCYNCSVLRPICRTHVVRWCGRDSASLWDFTYQAGFRYYMLNGHTCFSGSYSGSQPAGRGEERPAHDTPDRMMR